VYLSHRQRAGAEKAQGRVKMARIIMILNKIGDPQFVTDDHKLEVYGVGLSKDGVWGEVYRRGPSVDRVWPITLDRILGNAHEIGRYGDMADVLASLDTPKPRGRTRNAIKRNAQRIQLRTGLPAGRVGQKG
jgi:hypothetical protein